MKASPPIDATDGNAERSVARTVALATHSLDGPTLSEAQLDEMRAAVLRETRATPKDDEAKDC